LPEFRPVVQWDATTGDGEPLNTTEDDNGTCVPFVPWGRARAGWRAASQVSQAADLSNLFIGWARFWPTLGRGDLRRRQEGRRVEGIRQSGYPQAQQGLQGKEATVTDASLRASDVGMSRR
jgi:hypothetical protein